MPHLTRTKNLTKNKLYDPSSDLIGKCVAEWRAAKPDLDSSGKEIIDRIIRLESITSKLIEKTLLPFDLSYFEYAVLTTLHVANKEYSLQPNDLLTRLQCSSGGLSNILKHLESRGFIERSASTDDGRMVLVNLTQNGTELVDKVMPVHTQAELKLVAMLNNKEREVLTRLLSRVMVGNVPELMNPELERDCFHD